MTKYCRPGKPDFTGFSDKELLIAAQVVNRLVWSYDSSPEIGTWLKSVYGDLSTEKSERNELDSPFSVDLVGKCHSYAGGISAKPAKSLRPKVRPPRVLLPKRMGV